MKRVHRLWRPPRLHLRVSGGELIDSAADKHADEHADKHADEHGETWLELFYDLVFVAVLIQLGNVLSDDVSWTGLGRFVVLFAPVWWIWSNFTFYMNRFAADDVWHRLTIAVQIFFIAWLGASVGGAFGELSTQFVLCYVAVRLTLIALYWRTYRQVPETKTLLRHYIVGFNAVSAGLWLSSLLLPVESRYLLWLAAFVWEVVYGQLPAVVALHQRFPFRPEHFQERFGTLTIIVLGETFIKTITADSSLALTRDALLFSAPGVAVLFGLWWLYFEDTEDNKGDAIHRANPALWLFTHLPLSLALVAFGVGAKKLLEGTYDGHLDPAYALLYGGSLVLYALAMATLNLMGHKAFYGARALARLGMAAAVALVTFLNFGASSVPIVAWTALVILGQVIHDLWLARRVRVV